MQIGANPAGLRGDRWSSITCSTTGRIAPFQIRRPTVSCTRW
jgi:hypothetical protein